jgi:hypothetical protein
MPPIQSPILMIKRDRQLRLNGIQAMTPYLMFVPALIAYLALRSSRPRRAN